MNMYKILFLTAVAGHLLCGYCDMLITYVEGGQFRFSELSDNIKMQNVFSKMPEGNPVRSMVLGTLALTLCFFGYYGLVHWTAQYAEGYSRIMFAGMSFFFLFGVAHHILCGAAEWIYIRFGLTDHAREAVIDFFKKTSVTMIVCYTGLLVFNAAYINAVLSRAVPLPLWAAAVNVIPLALIMVPLHIGGSMNWAGAAMFAALFLMV